MMREQLGATLPRVEAVGSPTLQSMCADGLARLAEALGIEAADATLRALVGDGLGQVADAPIGERPRWSSDLSDDGTPFEWSIALGGGAPELRVLLEPLHPDASLERNWHAGLAANERYAANWAASLDRFDRIRDLFEPTALTATLAMWHAICLAPGRRPAIKLYLDPGAAGTDRAGTVAREALGRLGMNASWRRSAAVLEQLPGSRLLFFSLDLSSTPDARVKVYMAHPHAAAAELDTVIAHAGGCRIGEVMMLCKAVTGGTGPFSHRPLISCLAFTSSRDGTPVQATAHVPVRSYVRHDALAVDRLERYLGDDLGDTARRAVEAIARRPLSVGRGLVAYVSMRRTPGGRRVTTYLSAEAYAIKAPRLDLG